MLKSKLSTAFSPIALRTGAQELLMPAKGQLVALDMLRTAAILLVVTGHFPEVGRDAFPKFDGFLSSPAFAFGWSGVDLFFVLSGFLIGRQIWRELATRGSVNVPRFVIRRGFRIWPLYFFVALITPVLTGHWSYRITDWLFISNYFGGHVEGGWSLSTEEQFYLIAPVAIVVGSRFLRMRSWLIVMPLVIVGEAIARMLTARSLLASGLAAGAVKRAMYSPFHLHNDGLTVGLLVALVAVVCRDSLTATTKHRTAVWLACVGGLALGTAVHLVNTLIFPFLSLALIFGSIMTGLLVLPTRILALVPGRPFYILSRLSFGMYLNHFALLRWFSPFAARQAAHLLGGELPALLLTLGATILMSCAVAAITFVLIESPFLRLRTAWEKPGTDRPVSSPFDLTNPPAGPRVSLAAIDG